MYTALAVLLPLFLFGLISLTISSIILRREITKGEISQVKLISHSLEDYLKEPLHETALLIGALRNYTEEDSKIVQRIIDNILGSHDYIFSVQISDSSGKVHRIAPFNQEILGTDISGHDYYKESRKTGDIYWSSSFFSEQYDKPVTSVTIPYENGLVTLFITLSNISRIIYPDNHIDKERIVVVTDQNGVYIYHPDKNKVLSRENDIHFLDNKKRWQNSENNFETEYLGEKVYSYIAFIPDINWMIGLYKPIKSLYKPIKDMGLILVGLTFFFTLITVLFGNNYLVKVSAAIQTLLKSTKDVADGNYELFIPDVMYKDLSELSTAIEQMATDIRSREGVLKQAKNELAKNKEILEIEVDNRTRELKESITNLKLAQNKLVESEKMASLGGLVAGVAHEINTPIGVIVSAASYLEEQTRNFVKDYENNNISHKVFKKFCEEALKSTKLLLSSSYRASDLIKSFKQVAVDQTSEQRRKFELKEYVDEIVASNISLFKGKKIKVKVEFSNEIVVNSIPGALAQVLTNLLNNSAHHGFENRDNGLITIELSQKNGNALIVYRDNGVGMSSDIRKKIFEPFFTTKRSLGGSGLGMHIVYNLVTQTLNGNINCSENNKEGVQFIIEFPINL